MTSAQVRDLSSRKPFWDYASEYLEKGWWPIPLPPGQKDPPYDGCTGRFDPVADLTIFADADSRSNIAVRVPDEVLGIDVDAYAGGEKTIVDFCSRYGELGDTWCSSARNDGVSGIRFFTVPGGRRWPGKIGDGVQLISFRYRYAACFPSMHPTVKRIYRWYEPGKILDGKNFGGVIPAVGQLTKLSNGLIEGIKNVEYKEAARLGLGSKDLYAKLESCKDAKGEMCGLMQRSLDKGIAFFDEGLGGMHDELNSRTYHMVKLAVEGHRGVITALDGLRSSFLAGIERHR